MSTAEVRSYIACVGKLGTADTALRRLRAGELRGAAVLIPDQAV